MYNYRIFIGLLESLIGDMERNFHSHLETTFAHLTELSLILSQIRDHRENNEGLMVLTKMEDCINAQINSIVNELQSTLTLEKIEQNNELPEEDLI